MSATINVQMGRKCAECGKGGATDNGLCLKCTMKTMAPKHSMKSQTGRAIQSRWQAMMRAMNREG